jgi:hypothetical protein
MTLSSGPLPVMPCGVPSVTKIIIPPHYKHLVKVRGDLIHRQLGLKAPLIPGLVLANG